MLKSYIKIALRSLLRKKGYTFINIFGLSVGIGAAVLILLYAESELSYDQFHSKADRIYHVYKERITPTGTQKTYDTWAPLSVTLKEDFPEIENSTRVASISIWLEAGDRRFQEPTILTDADFFSLFDFKLKRGTAEMAFSNLNSIVISQEVANRLFPGQNPMGKTIDAPSLNNQYIITGVLDEIPYNSSIQPSVLIPIQSHPQYEGIAGNWGSSFMDTYVLLGEEAEPKQVEQRFEAFIARIWNEQTAQNTNLGLLSLPDLYDDRNDNRQYAYILLAVACIIVSIASINFMNLATARSMERAREAGMRKVLGALKRQLVGQYLVESLAITFVSMLIGLGLAALLLPQFNEAYEVQLQLDLVGRPLHLGGFISLGLLIGLLSGLYPAFYLTSLKSVDSLKGKVVKTGKASRMIRNSLVVLQFVFSILLIVGTMVIGKQVKYMKNQDMAFDQANLLVLPISTNDFPSDEDAPNALATMRNNLAQNAQVLSMTSTSILPGDFNERYTFVIPEGFSSEQRLRMLYTFVDHDFFSTMKIELKGRDFIPNSEEDRATSVIVNQAAMDAFGWDSFEGKSIRARGINMKVVGVSEDYNFESLADEVAPVIHQYRRPSNGIHGLTALRIQEGSAQQVLAEAREEWTRILPSVPFDYYFLDDQFERLYANEDRLTGAIGAFSGIAVIIACLGLLGLSSIITTQRTKEIGVRKVLGASISGIILLLTKGYAQLILIAFLVALPLAIYVLNLWLEGFAYRTDVGVLVFVAALAGTLVVSLMTIGIQTLKAATANPVKAMRYE